MAGVKWGLFGANLATKKSKNRRTGGGKWRRKKKKGKSVTDIQLDSCPTNKNDNIHRRNRRWRSTDRIKTLSVTLGGEEMSWHACARKLKSPDAIRRIMLVA